VEIGEWPSTGERAAAYRQVRDLGLEAPLAEFDTFGFTVLTPEQLRCPAVFDEMREEVLRIAAERTGVTHTLDGAVDYGAMKRARNWQNQFILYYLLVEHTAFRTAACHPAIRALLTLVMTPGYQLYSVVSHVKSKGDSYGPTLGIHADAGGFPDPLPGPGTYAHVCNTNWLLTDYTRENGALAVVPGSHRRCRQPLPGEGVDEIVPVEASAGSVILFHGNLWHGAVPKKSDGLRLSVNVSYVNSYAKPEEDYSGIFSPEHLAASGGYLAQLVGENDQMSRRDSAGPDSSLPSDTSSVSAADL